VTKGRALERARWGGAIDNGGDGVLAEVVRTTAPWGSVASVGLAAGTEVETSVMPFILRGVSLIGITSANCPGERRRRVWQRLASDWYPPHLDALVAETVGLDDLDRVFERLLAGQAQGRTVVRIAG
jgi:NADPH2:quinone reductase